MNRGRLDIARRADLQPAHEAFTGRVTAPMIRQHGSYEAARKALNSMNGDKAWDRMRDNLADRADYFRQLRKEGL